MLQRKRLAFCISAAMAAFIILNLALAIIFLCKLEKKRIEIASLFAKNLNNKYEQISSLLVVMRDHFPKENYANYFNGLKLVFQTNAFDYTNIGVSNLKGE